VLVGEEEEGSRARQTKRWQIADETYLLDGDELDEDDDQMERSS
jgi:hypothetical protein